MAFAIDVNFFLKSIKNIIIMIYFQSPEEYNIF